MIKKAFLIVILGAAAAAALVWFRHRFPGRTAGIEEVRALVDSGEAAAALPALYRLVSSARPLPERNEARLLLARVLTEKGELTPAQLLLKELAEAEEGGYREEALFRLWVIAGKEGDEEGARRYRRELQTSYPRSEWRGGILLESARGEREKGNLEAARKKYLEILESFPSGAEGEEARRVLGEINLELLYSPVIVPGFARYTVVRGDTLTSIAARHHTTPELLAKINGIDGHLIRPGQNLKVPLERFEVVVSKSENSLMVLYGGEFFKLYRVGTGTGGSTPSGEFRIATKLVDPPWYHRGRVISPCDPENILGTRWMGFQDPYAAYGIHGTTEPETIGTQSSAGCVRMHNREVEELFNLLPRGSRVLILE